MTSLNAAASCSSAFLLFRSAYCDHWDGGGGSEVGRVPCLHCITTEDALSREGANIRTQRMHVRCLERAELAAAARDRAWYSLAGWDLCLFVWTILIPFSLLHCCHGGHFCCWTYRNCPGRSHRKQYLWYRLQQQWLRSIANDVGDLCSISSSGWQSCVCTLGVRNAARTLVRNWMVWKSWSWSPRSRNTLWERWATSSKGNI